MKIDAVDPVVPRSQQEPVTEVVVREAQAGAPVASEEPSPLGSSGLDAASARERLARFDEIISPQMREELQNPTIPELSIEELDRLQNRPPPSPSQLEGLMQHGEREVPPDVQAILDARVAPSKLPAVVIEGLENPTLRQD